MSFFIEVSGNKFYPKLELCLHFTKQLTQFKKKWFKNTISWWEVKEVWCPLFTISSTIAIEDIVHVCFFWCFFLCRSLFQKSTWCFRTQSEHQSWTRSWLDSQYPNNRWNPSNQAGLQSWNGKASPQQVCLIWISGAAVVALPGSNFCDCSACKVLKLFQ